MDFRKKQRIKRVLYSRFTIVLLVLLVLWISRATWNVYQKEHASREKLDRALSDQQELIERQEFLEVEIDRLGTKEGVEKEIRERFGLAKDGEHVIVVVDTEDEDASASARESGFWALVKDFFSF